MVSIRRFLKGIVAGAGIGYVVGLLFAPEKGEETRRKLQEKGKDLKGKIEKFSADAKDKIGEIKDIAKKTFNPEKEED